MIPSDRLRTRCAVVAAVTLLALGAAGGDTGASETVTSETVTSDTGASDTVTSDTGASETGASESTTLDAVIIEAEPLLVERTIEELMQSFREALRRDRFEMPFSERPLPGGARELNTRSGRFCVVPLPTQFASDLARGIDLAQRCAAY
ncbi:MAG: hypothetical protein IT532_12335 [Burkholderiales bacterium]|nr:hypothetical protein [Burkholderiales bacterium]